MSPSPDLARFRRCKLIRIVLRDVLGAASLADVTKELSNLADAILDATYRRVRAAFVERHGEPCLPDGRICGFSVISLGKLGGEELNYSSDIDLMFVYGGNGETGGPRASPIRSSSRRSPTSTSPCSPPTPAKACATASTCGCAPTARRAKSASPMKARGIITPAARAIGRSRC